jgi:hypothetical protein
MSKAQNKDQRQIDPVRDAIVNGVNFLRERGEKNGDWEVDAISAQWPGGETSLALLALLKSGVQPSDPLIERGLRYLRRIYPQHTYVVGLQTMAFSAAGQAQDREIIQRNCKWLIENRSWKDNRFVGWSYGKERSLAGPDNSNTDYAVLGLLHARRAGAKIDREVWRAIRDYYLRTQRGGGWGYAALQGQGPTPTMAAASLWGLLIASKELGGGRETFLRNGSVAYCGAYWEKKAAADALVWLGDHFSVEVRNATYYNLDCVQRTGRLTGRRFLGNHDWYQEGCAYLLRAQNPDGFWQPQSGFDTNRVVATSFALLFLSEGRTPVLVYKLVHGPADDWNNDHNDAGNLVEYASRELFKRQPLTWQIIDARRFLVKKTEAELATRVGEPKQSPIVYFNGHLAPTFTQAEEKALKKYVEQDGFIMAEACCGRAEFDRGFRDLVKRLFPDMPLKPLDQAHPIWHAHSRITPGDPFKLEGIERDGKTLVVYSPQDLSCLWEANQFDSGRGQAAFRLGANIVAYATAMEQPKPRRKMLP